MARLFIGIDVTPTAALAEVLDELGRLSPLYAAVPARRVHLTLRFLGEVKPGRAQAIGAAMDAAAGGMGWFNLALRGLGRLPQGPRRLPRIVYAALADPEPAAALAGAIDRALASIDPPIGPDPKPWTPHVTLARHRARRRPTRAQRRQVARLLERRAAADLGSSPVRYADLVHSKLTPRGPRYTLWHRAPLGPAAARGPGR